MGLKKLLRCGEYEHQPRSRRAFSGSASEGGKSWPRRAPSARSTERASTRESRKTGRKSLMWRTPTYQRSWCSMLQSGQRARLDRSTGRRVTGAGICNYSSAGQTICSSYIASPAATRTSPWMPPPQTTAGLWQSSSQGIGPKFAHWD